MPQNSAKVPDHDPVYLRRRAVLSGDIEAPATVLVAVLLKHFEGPEFFDWEPDVLYQEVRDDFGAEMPAEVSDKIWALVSALTTDLFYKDPLFFNHVANALGGGPTNMEDFELATLEEIAWAVIEVGMNDLDDADEQDFAPEIQVFVGGVLKREGLGPIAPLEWAETEAPGFSSDDVTVAAMQTQDRQEKQDALREHLKQEVIRLHRELQLCGAGPASPRRH